jgi:hypothetical protein
VFWARSEVARALDGSETGEAFGEPAHNICHGAAPVGSAVKPGPSIPRPGHTWRGPVELLLGDVNYGLIERVFFKTQMNEIHCTKVTTNRSRAQPGRVK